MNSEGELIYLREGEKAPPGFVRMPDIPDRFKEAEEREKREICKSIGAYEVELEAELAAAEIRKMQPKRVGGKSRMERSLSEAARRMQSR